MKFTARGTVTVNKGLQTRYDEGTVTTKAYISGTLRATTSGLHKSYSTGCYEGY